MMIPLVLGLWCLDFREFRSMSNERRAGKQSMQSMAVFAAAIAPLEIAGIPPNARDLFCNPSLGQ
jgi:hypothetical protein